MEVPPLPRALASWAGLLSLFPREIVLALGPLVERLHALIREGRGAPGTAGEPDGYDGIARRGPYERLLGTEWLLLSEMPEEFLRRVAAAEHAFLRLAHRAPSGGRRAVALFDAGPDQLGGPRIAHLAALVVLAARLERRRGTLSWGVLQDEGARLETEVSRRSVRALVDARSARAVTRADVARWLASPAVAGVSEVWLAGAEDLRANEERRTASMLIVADALERDARRLVVRALPAEGTPGARPAEVVLDLPAEGDCLRILRDPFDGAPVPRSAAPAADPSAGLVFSWNGRRLYARTADGRLLVFVVPSSARAPMPPPGVFKPPEGQTPVAAGIEPRKYRTVVVCAGHGAYFTHRLALSRRKAIDSRKHRSEAGLEVPAAPGPLVPLRAGDDDVIRFADPPERLVTLEGDRVSAAPAADPGTPGASPLWREGYSAEITGPHGDLVIGYLGDRLSAASKAMVLLGAERRRIERFWSGERRRLLSTTSPIHAVRLEPALGLVGFVTEAGEVGVYSFRQEAMVLRAHPGSHGP